MSVAFIENIPVNNLTWTHINPDTTCRQLILNMRSKDPYYISNIDVDNGAYFTVDSTLILCLPTALTERRLSQLYCKSTIKDDVLEIIHTG